MSIKKKITIITCCYNEEGNIRRNYEEIKKVFESLPEYDYEHIFEDNDSTDGTKSILREIAAQDKNVKVVFNGQNYGVERSGLHSWSRATGDALIGMAADLQDPPEIIPQLISRWEEGYKIVLGQRIDSKENRVMNSIRGLYYRVIDFFADHKQFHNVTGFGLYDRQAIDSIVEMGDQDLYVRGLLTQMGLSISIIPYVQNKREWGKSSYNLTQYFDYAFEGLTQTSHKPLRLVTVLGVVMSLVSLVFAIIYLILKIVYWDAFVTGMSPVLIGMFLIGSIQLLCIGVIGEYIGQILTKVTRKPRFIEKETINFNELNH